MGPDSIPWREVFPEITDQTLPGVCLRGARAREGLTQKQLSERTGIPASAPLARPWPSGWARRWVLGTGCFCSREDKMEKGYPREEVLGTSSLAKALSG